MARTLDGEKISSGISFKKLSLLSRRTTILTEREACGFLPMPKGGGICRITIND
ncbi:MAG: hypothetical protein LBU32_31010 [Clostridiales bacterium]|nr:hypothetical protein [Clostridiales bacterium]